VCEHFGVHPKSIFKNKKEVFVGHYKKDDDDFILEQIKPIIKMRSTYGYKRVTAMLNKQRELLELPRVNKKRVYRVMKIKGLLLPKTETAREHQSIGKVMTWTAVEIDCSLDIIINDVQMFLVGYFICA